MTEIYPNLCYNEVCYKRNCTVVSIFGPVHEIMVLIAYA